MTPDRLLVTLIGAALVALIVWFFWLKRKPATRAAAIGSAQEVNIQVKGGYTPDLIVVEHGRPVRLNFRREETAACSEMVLFPDFGKQAELPTGETVTLELTPEQPGEYEFACQMGMLRGRLVVE